MASQHNPTITQVVDAVSANAFTLGELMHMEKVVHDRVVDIQCHRLQADDRRIFTVGDVLDIVLQRQLQVRLPIRLHVRDVIIDDQCITYECWDNCTSMRYTLVKRFLDPIYSLRITPALSTMSPTEISLKAEEITKL